MVLTPLKPSVLDESWDSTGCLKTRENFAAQLRRRALSDAKVLRVQMLLHIGGSVNSGVSIGNVARVPKEGMLPDL
jgi:hypothetical protein